MKEREVRISARLYECRDHARRLLGSQYAASMKQIGAIIQGVAKEDGTTLLQAAIKVAKDPKIDGTTTVLVFAAAVELEEPSTVGETP